MIVHECQQNSGDWWALHIGRPSASGMVRILTNTGKISSRAEGYMHKLIAEWLMNAPTDDYQSYWMERGHDLEPEAWAYYEMQYDVDVRRGGYITDDQGRAGCSPDGRVYDGDVLLGGIELKCPKPETHIGYLLGGKTVADSYKHQVQTCMLLTGAQWWDVMSYHPLLPPAVVRVTRDDDAEYRQALADALWAFCDKLDAAKAALLEQGYKPRDIQT